MKVSSIPAADTLASFNFFGYAGTASRRAPIALLDARFQAADADLAAIAALATTSFGRGLLTLADAAALRSSAGLVIGTDVQAYHATLAALAALTPTAYGKSLLELANAAALRSSAGLVIGTDVQAYDADLAAIAALATTSFGRGLLTLADAAALQAAAELVPGSTVAGITLENPAAEVLEIIIGSILGAASLDGEYFDLPGEGETVRFWFNVDASSTPPAAPGRLVEIALSTTNTPARDFAATAMNAAIGGDVYFGQFAQSTLLSGSDPVGLELTYPSNGPVTGAASNTAYVTVTTTQEGTLGTPALTAISGGLLTALNASNLSSGTLAAARIADGSLSTAKISGLAASATTDATNASNISSGSLALARLAQSGATSGQVMTFNGTLWAPATPSAGTLADGSVTAAKLAAAAVDLAGSKITGVLAQANGGTGGAAAADLLAVNPAAWEFRWNAPSSAGASGSGVNTPSPHSVNVTSGATASSRGMAIVPATNSTTFLGPAAGDCRYANFAKRFSAGFALTMIQATSTGAMWVKIGQGASAAGDLAARGLQIKVSNLDLTAACHNGTSLTTSGTLATLTVLQGVYIILQSDGVGNVAVYLNGTLAATLTGGPTDATTSSFEIAVECTNGANAATQRTQVSPVKVIVAP